MRYRWRHSAAAARPMGEEDKPEGRIQGPSATVGGCESLRQELEALWYSHNRAGMDCTTVSAEYLEVIDIRA